MTIDLRLIADGGLAAEVDPNARLTATATTLTCTGMTTNETEYWTIDYGASYFTGTYYLEGEINATSYTGTATKRFNLGFGDALGGFAAVANQAGMSWNMSASATTCTPVAALYQTSVSSSAASSTTNLATATLFYYKVGVYSSLGQYGGVNIQVFSDSGYATQVAQKTVVRTESHDYRYLYAAQSYASGGSADSISVTNASITLFQPAASINLTTGVETDTGTGRLVVYADCIVATALNIANSETAKHVAIDEGAEFFADYKVSGVLNLTAFASGAVGQMFDILAVTDAAADAGLANYLQGISIYWATATTFKPYIHQAVGGSDSFSTVGPTLNTNQPYSFVLERSGTTLTLKVWNDLVLTNFAGASQVGSTLTWTGRATTTYRYLMPVASYLNGATSRSSTFTLGGVKRQGTGLQSGSHTAAGGIVLGGTATYTKGKVYTATGGIIAGGSAAIARTAGRIATGGFVLGGNSAFVANGAVTAAHTASGGFILGGTAVVGSSRSHVSTGGFILGGSSAYSFNLQANVQEIVFELYDSNGAALTGKTISLALRTTPGSKLMDWNDLTFKLSGWGSSTTAMSEIDSVTVALQGKYKKEIDINTFTDGRYQAFMTYTYTESGVTKYIRGSLEFLVDDGQLVDEYTATNSHTIVLATDTLEASMTRVSAAITNKHVLNPADGTVNVYDDAGALLYSGLAYSDAAGTVLYDGTAAVHHTTRLT